jgi:transcriptional regulator GlxA family with amidase domain
MTTSVGIYVFPDVEVLDFAGPYEVFTTASRMFRRSHPATPELFSVFTIAKESGLFRARAGLQAQADYAFSTHPEIDVLIVPGGVVSAELASSEVTNWIAHVAASASLTASVCTGSFLLAKAGLLDGKCVTTHWEDIDDMRTMFPSVEVLENRRWVDQERFITSGGISAGMDMSLHIVERLAGRELAISTAHQMEFDWRENS